MPPYGMGGPMLNTPFFALKHSYEFYHHVKPLVFLNGKKRCELFGASLLEMAATRWESVCQAHVEVAGFQPTLDYFKKCLQEWNNKYFGSTVRDKHFRFMRAKNSLKKDVKLPCDEYAFWEALFLYNELGDFLYEDPAHPVPKLTEQELKLCFFEGQPDSWQRQFLESPNAPKPENMPLEELKEHFKTKEDNVVKNHLLAAQKQQQTKKNKCNEQTPETGKSQWKKRKNKNGKIPNKPNTNTANKNAIEHHVPDNAICIIHGNKGPTPHVWGCCAMNPKNKDDKELDKYRPKKGGKKNPRNEAHNIEAMDVDTKPPAKKVKFAIDYNEAIGKSENFSANFCESHTPDFISQITHHLNCLSLQAVPLKSVKAATCTSSPPSWSTACSSQELKTASTLNKV